GPFLLLDDNGVVKAVQGEDMFYYFIPRCTVSGTVRVDGVDEILAEGSSGWYDHEFGHHGAVSEPVEVSGEAADSAGKDTTKVDIAWNWISVQFDDNTEMTAYALHDLVSDTSAGNWAVAIDANGDWRGQTDAVFYPSGEWRSTRTFNEYPNHWRVELPSEGLQLEAAVAFEDQEFITLISKPAFWEGRVHVTGTRHGKPVKGTGYIERSGYAAIEDLDSFFKSVGKATRASVRALLPFDPDRELIQDLVADKDRPDWIRGVDTEQFVDTMIKPIREITDRGGKSWRSYAALACCDVVGGDSREFVQWLAMPELMHTGSLIVDDVQDRSDVRRGGPTCHKVFGDAIAINAGTACYFLGQKLLVSDKVSAQGRLRLYDFYFAALRAGHSGQALDIGGIDDLMPAAVKTGDASEVEERVMAVHRLKTAVPAASLARMGALVGEGSEAQIDGVGRFFEAVGLAFQIIDDVLNLRGFKGDLKSRGEDLAMGKVTLPVARALPRLDAAERTWLWTELQAKHTDPAKLAEMIDKIEDCGALSDCEQQARTLVDEAWSGLDPLIEPSLPKLMLRAFSWYVLERHY
ncbi:MAG: polyprenyl synthetase family protein, partial [Myxococcales bacterium]|nr:polyprenyl synthetase family protein [Myxococcales bacterium]